MKNLIQKIKDMFVNCAASKITMAQMVVFLLCYEGSAALMRVLLTALSK